MKFLKALNKTICIGSLMTWIHVVLHSNFKPEFLALPFCHWKVCFFREDTAGMIAFGIFLITFFIWIYKRK